MAYKVNDTILYGAQGICRIAEITERDFGGNFIKYYVLKTVFNDNSTILVPMENEALTAKMRRILSAEEIYDLIQSMPDEELIWIENETARKEQYRAILSNGDREELVRLIKTYIFASSLRLKRGRSCIFLMNGF